MRQKKTMKQQNRWKKYIKTLRQIEGNIIYCSEEMAYCTSLRGLMKIDLNPFLS